MNSNWSYSLETAKLGYDLCGVDLWPMTLTSCMDITSVIGNNSWKFRDDMMTGTQWKRCDKQTDGRTSGRTDRQTDRKRCSWSCLVAAKNKGDVKCWIALGFVGQYISKGSRLWNIGDREVVVGSPHQNNRDINQVVLHLWSKFGDPCLNRWWVIMWTNLKLRIGLNLTFKWNFNLEGQG